ncbi:hypothetical protein NECID01_0524 [Nematocida sp. AWRm77]|nr:hypothetical protein NECID01_0524 [Nematocida sp. AWRm77]
MRKAPSARLEHHLQKSVREEYIELLAETKEEKRKPKEDGSVLYTLYEKTNTLLQEVETAPELRLDACVSGEVVDLYSKQVGKLCAGTLLTVAQFVSLMKTPEAWRQAQEYSTDVYRGAYFPRLLCLREEESPPRKKPARRREESTEIEKPGAEENQALQQTDAPWEVKKIFQVLQSIGTVELLRLVVDPQDFSKTVENLLYLSFAVKLERAFLHTKNGTLYVSSTKQEEETLSHFILTISPQEHARAVKQLHLETSMLG